MTTLDLPQLGQLFVLVTFIIGSSALFMFHRGWIGSGNNTGHTGTWVIKRGELVVNSRLWSFAKLDWKDQKRVSLPITVFDDSRTLLGHLFVSTDGSGKECPEQCVSIDWKDPLDATYHRRASIITHALLENPDKIAQLKELGPVFLAQPGAVYRFDVPRLSFRLKVYELEYDGAFRISFNRIVLEIHADKFLQSI